MSRTNEKPETPNLTSVDLELLATNQTELLSELWILRDRVLCLEHQLAAAGVLKQDQDSYVPPDDLAARLDQERDEFVARVAGAGHRRSFSAASVKAQVVKPRD